MLMFAERIVQSSKKLETTDYTQLTVSPEALTQRKPWQDEKRTKTQS
jgi:hypothetical protein